MDERNDAVTARRPEWWISKTEHFVHCVEIFAAVVFAILFAIGVVDLVLQIGGSIVSGEITDPLVVIGFIDTGLLLLIIVEIYQTVIAYIEESSTNRIVVLVTYTGIIAMVRKIITFRTDEYATTMDAFLAAGAYALVFIGLVALLWVYHSSDREIPKKGATP